MTGRRGPDAAAGRPDDLAQALEVWADDARGVAATIDPEAVVRAALGAEVDERTLSVLFRRYVAAAVVLFALGAGGTLWIQARPRGGPAAARGMHALEAERVELMGRRLLSSYAGGWNAGAQGE